MLIAQPIGAVAAAVLVMTHADRLTGLGIHVGFIAMVAFLVGGTFIRFLFMTILCAKCPVCHQASVVRGLRPITYECMNCVNFQKTGVSEGE